MEETKACLQILPLSIRYEPVPIAVNIDTRLHAHIPQWVLFGT